MAESTWFQDPMYQNYWQHMSKIQKQSDEQAQMYEQYSAAHWRSVAQGLHHENQMLHQMVQQLLGASIETVQEQHLVPAAHREDGKRTHRKHKKEKADAEDEVGSDKGELSNAVQNNGPDLESETGDSMKEYLRFVQETDKHRERRDRERQLEGTTEMKFNPADEIVTDAILDRADDIATDFERLKKEMSVLYGKDALKVRQNMKTVHTTLFFYLKVHSLETKVQLQFDQWNDKNRALVWPAMPLNIRRGV